MSRKKRKRWEYAQLWTVRGDNSECQVDYSHLPDDYEGEDRYDHFLTALHDLGDDGWELVSYWPDVRGKMGDIHWHAVFKRGVS